MPDKEYSDVRKFHQKFGFLFSNEPRHLDALTMCERVECMQEEFGEFLQGWRQEDLAAMADALIDLVYFIKGTAVMMGLPWDKMWDAVQAANMAKVRGTTKRGHRADAAKPEDWRPPDLLKILVDAGYDPNKHSKKEAHIGYPRPKSK